MVVRKLNRRFRLKQVIVTLLCIECALGNVFVHASVSQLVIPPLSPPPHMEGPSSGGVVSGDGPFSGGFGETTGANPSGLLLGEFSAGGVRPTRRGGGEFEPQEYAGDDDIGGQGWGDEGGGLGAPGPAGIGGGKGTGIGDGNGNSIDEAQGASHTSFGTLLSRSVLLGTVLLVTAVADRCCPPGNCYYTPPKYQPPQPAAPPPAPEVTRDPIYMRFGAVTENTDDIDLPNPMGIWRYSRSYMSIDQVRNAPTKQGWGWLNNQDNPRIRRTFDPDELKYLVRADSEIQFKRTSPGSNTFYGVGSDLRILDDTANNRFLVRSSRNDQLLIFGYSGLLAETSTVGWFGSGKTGFTYTYAGGQLDYMISPDGQGYKIDFNYDLHFWISELG